MKILLTKSIFIGAVALFSLPVLANSTILGKFTLTPAGSFEASSDAVLGKGYKEGSKFHAKELKVAMKSIRTGNSMRDEHMLKKFQAEKYPFIIVKDIKAENGKGTGSIIITNNKPKPITFTYKELKKKNTAEATFKLDLSEYNIEGLSYLGVGVDDEAEIVATIEYEVKK